MNRNYMDDPFKPLSQVKLTASRKAEILAHLRNEMAAARTQTARSTTMPLRSKHLKRRPHNTWLSFGAAVAVVLVGGVIVLNQTGLLHTRFETGSGQKKPGPMPVTVKHPAALTGVSMVDAQNGWLLDPNTDQLFRTTSGGSHWKVVTPPLPKSTNRRVKNPPICASVLDENTAWVAYGISKAQPNGAGELDYVTVYRTTDGGLHWQQASVTNQFPNGSQVGQFPTYLTFVNEKQGWLVTGLPNLGFGGTMPGGLYHTVDGGIHWSKVSDSQQKDNTLLFGNPYWVQFLDGRVGLTTGAKAFTEGDYPAPDTRTAMVYRTSDSGRTWKALSLPYSAGGFPVAVYSPTFASGHGVMAIQTRTKSESALHFEVSADRGLKWREASEIKMSNPEAPSVVDFRDQKTGWVIANGQLYQTGDGAKHWTTIGSAPSGVVQLDFADQRHGLAITVDLSSHPADNPVLARRTLMQTTDGGHTWKTVKLP